MKSKEVFCHLTLNKDEDIENVKLNEEKYFFQICSNLYIRYNHL